MIGLFQEGKALPTRFRGARIQILFILQRVLASRPQFLLQAEPDFHWLSQTSEWSCTED
jgi:hypothetical protein